MIKLDKKEVQYLEINTEEEGSRLDNILLNLMKGVPRSKVYSIIRKGEVRVNKSRAKPSYRVKRGDLVRVPPHKAKQNKTLKAKGRTLEIIESSILEENTDYLILDKPTGIASHGGSGISLGLIETIRQLNYKYKNAHLVHRLDKDTSGCMVVALKKNMLKKLQKELREQSVEKDYIAVVHGLWPKNLTKITLRIEKKNTKSNERFVQISDTGKESTSLFKIISTKNENLTLLSIKIITGRTHQIRVHTSSQNHPVIGDLKYGDNKINKLYKKRGLNRMMLHSKSINFKNLGIFCNTEIPDDFYNLLEYE
tara:strand:- start:13066 stop:13995 length:930 start_codon:yes stop_codon:yes gene_type:complete